jgi:hypothetical protein
MQPWVFVACAGILLTFEQLNERTPFGPNGEVARDAREMRNWVGDRTGLNKPSVKNSVSGQFELGS